MVTNAMMTSFLEAKKKLKVRVEKHLSNMFQTLNAPSERLKRAMEYAVLSQGKRLRPLLVYLTGRALNIPLEKLDNVACAVECMHAYSLVHDDLPAMDDDDLRRGKPTCHKAFDEATAILAGDALQTLAFQQILLIDSVLINAEQKNAMALLLSAACGAEGMVSGQAMDLEYLEQSIPQELLKTIHHLKTGIFLETCVKLALLAVPDMTEHHQDALLSFAHHLGLAFQIQDDYLDRYGDTEILGKLCGSDEQQGKKTYAFLYPQQELLSLWKSLYHQAAQSLDPLGSDADELRELVSYLANRGD
jgi:farnesyl diphosphate synthase